MKMKACGGRRDVKHDAKHIEDREILTLLSFQIRMHSNARIV
jgi:hypothetical protein